MRKNVFAILVVGTALFSTGVDASSLVPVERVEPTYPSDALRSGVEGFVEVEFVVSNDGSVESVSVVSARPSRTFERSAVEAVRKWKFEPGGGRGKVRLDFAL